MPIAFLVTDDFQNFKVLRRKYAPENSIAKVPSNIPEEDYPFVIGEQVDDGDGNMVWQAIIDPIAKGESLTEIEKENQKTLAHSQYIASIDTEMISIFGSTDRDEANALYNTWKEWKEDPIYFSDKGLLDEFGAALDTGSKISIYAQQKIDQCKEYSVFLINRKKQFKEELEQIG